MHEYRPRKKSLLGYKRRPTISTSKMQMLMEIASKVKQFEEISMTEKVSGKQRSFALLDE